jgi:phosphoribosylglycinamide formyltransferase-1
MATLDLGVLISGRGSNLQAILDAIAAGRLDARVRLVLSNRPDAAGLIRAERAGVPTAVIPHQDFPDRPSFDAALVQALRAAGVAWVVLAGFMRLLTPVLLDAFPSRVINIHPSLLPAFPGVDAQRQALEHGVRITGCTVHLVDAGTDTGPILAQAAAPVLDGDDRDALAARLLELEHALLVQTLRWIAEGRVEILPPAAGARRPRVRIAGAIPALGVAGGAA